MKKYLAVTASVVLCAISSIPLAASGAAADDEPSNVRQSAAGKGTTPVAAAPEHCDIPIAGWMNCQVVKARADDGVDVQLAGSTAGVRVDCNLNELNSGNQLNRDTAQMRPGDRRPLWHNNTGRTVYADLRCASPATIAVGAKLDVIHW